MKTIKLFALASILIVGITGCSKGNQRTGDVTIVDGLGNEIQINRSEINKIVCVGAGALRLYSYAGDLSLLVGAEDIDRNVGADNFETAPRPYYDVNKEFFATLPSIGPGGPAANKTGPDYEKIAAVKPDLIFSQFNDPSINSQLASKTGAKVVYLSYGGNAGAAIFNDEIKKSLQNIDAILNTDKGSKVISYMDSCKTNLENIAAKYTNKPTAFVGCIGNWGPQSIYSTSGVYAPFTVSGINNVAPSTVSHGTISKESLVSGNPSKIFIDAGGINKLREEYPSEKEILSALDAVKNNEVYLEMPAVAYMGNIEVMLANCFYISSIVYPNEYKNFDIGAKYDEISQKFLGKASYADACNKSLSFGGYQKINLEQKFGSQA